MIALTTSPEEHVSREFIEPKRKFPIIFLNTIKWPVCYFMRWIMRKHMYLELSYFLEI